MGSAGEEKVLEGVQEVEVDYVPDDKWVPSSNKHKHKAPVVKVTEPTGSFCEMNSRFSVPLPPDDVYDIVIDPNNRRVFKNVKEVIYRKVLEDDGTRQLLEVEQLGRWRFLVFNGTFSCRVRVEQDRQEHTMRYELAKEGMMKQFRGSWKIDPKFEKEAETSDSEDRSASAKSSSGRESVAIAGEGKLIGSWVTLQQVVQPALVPPWPLSKYVRGVCGQIIQDVCIDLQLEATRLAELKSSADAGKNSDMHQLD